MSIVRRGNSRFWYMQFQLKGRTYIRSSRTTNHKVAEQMEDEWKANLHSQQYQGKHERISLLEAMRLFVKTKKGTANFENLEYQQLAVERLMNVRKPLDELTSRDLERFVTEREADGVGPQTLKHGFNLIRGTIKYVKKLEYLTPDVSFPKIKLPKYRLRYLSIDEERRLLSELNPRREGKGLRPYELRNAELKRTMQDAFDLVIALLDTGARYSEIANIRWTSIRLDSREIHLWRPKVENESILYMTERVHAVFLRRNQSRSSEYVFRNRKGGPRGYASQAIRKAIKRAGLQGCTIHTLRHTLASRLVQNGMSVYEVRDILGHTDIKTTMRYAHLEQRQVMSRARDVINKLNGQSPT